MENPARGKIDFSDDVDWFKLLITFGTTYQIDLEGQATGRGSLRDPKLRRVFDWDGQRDSRHPRQQERRGRQLSGDLHGG